MTIEMGIAKFSGVEGTYYGRMDLPIPTVEPRFASLGGYLYPEGAIGVGWYSPKQNAGVSALFVVETLTVSLFEHHGFGTPVLLASGPYDSGLFYWMNYYDYPILGESYLDGGPPGSLYTETTVRWAEDMHFFMYGWSSASGPARLDNVVAYGVPEPSAFVVLALGVGYLAVRRRSIIES